MYKLMWYDRNCNPIADGLASFFVEDIGEFAKEWDSFPEKDLTFCVRKDMDELKGKLQRACSGEHFTDWHDPYELRPELEFLQEDKGTKILEEKTWTMEGQTLETWNAYCCSTKIMVRKAIFTLQSIQFKGIYYLTAQYKLLGVATESWHEPGDDKRLWERCTYYGNPVLKCEYHGVEKSSSLNDFKEDVLQTICFVTLSESEEMVGMPEELDEDLIGQILADIPGEGG